MVAQLSWESICLTSRGSQVRALQRPPCFYGPVVQLVRTLACHARGRRFEPVPGRHFFMASQLSWQSRGLKILVSVVRFHLKPPYKVVFLQKYYLFFYQIIYCGIEKDVPNIMRQKQSRGLFLGRGSPIPLEATKKSSIF